MLAFQLLLFSTFRNSSSLKPMQYVIMIISVSVVTTITKAENVSPFCYLYFLSEKERDTGKAIMECEIYVISEQRINA